MYEIGDRFVVVREVGVRGARGPQHGDTGTLVDVGVATDGKTPLLMIEFDNHFYGGHTCSGRCRSGHGWNFRSPHIGVLINLINEPYHQIDLSCMEELL